MKIKPEVIGLRAQDNRHPVMDWLKRFVRSGRNDRAALNSFLASPTIPNAGEREWRLIGHLKDSKAASI